MIPPDVGMIPVEQAAAQLGITVPRLLGFIARNGVTDPVGDHEWVYEDTLASLKKRLSVSAAAALSND